ncbi:hypothetical protein BSKO_04945 [Bryopsis sp. KO-2023]|nr:hypothetical protein BSKO_04945 [Bryopsis sp. KO-2023]
MRQTCQLEESISERVKSWIDSQGGVEVGLLVGTASGRDVVIDLLKTPEDESGAPASCKDGGRSGKQSGGKSQQEEPDLKLEIDLIVDHASLVCHMLPGGVWITGVYLFSPHSSIKPVQQILCETLKALRKQCPRPECDGDNMHILHASSINSKVSMRVSPDATRTPSNLIVYDPKYSSIKPMCSLQCRYHVSVSYPLVGSPSTRKKIWKELVEMEAKRLESAFCVESAGSMKSLDETQPMGKAVELSESDSENSGVVEVSWVVPMDGGAADVKEGDVNGKASLSGVLEARVYTHEKEQLGQAVRMLKGDLLSTLRARFKIMEESDLLGADDLDRTSSIRLPRRVWFPWKCGISMCDHLTHGESTEAAVQNAAELLSSLQIASDDIIDTEMYETESSSGGGSVDWNPSSKEVTEDSTASQKEPSAASTCTPVSLAVSAGAMAVGFFGALIGWYSRE